MASRKKNASQNSRGSKSASPKKPTKKASAKKQPAKKSSRLKASPSPKATPKKTASTKTARAKTKAALAPKARTKSAEKKAPQKVHPGSAANKLKVGDLAPDFSLVNQDALIVRLKDHLGKRHVVLYFYPRAMTPGCTVQACGIRDHLNPIKKAGGVVLGISPDKVANLHKFRERDKLNFDLLSDEDKSLAMAYGVWGPKKFMGREFMGVRRWTFIIGKDGLIKHIMDKVNTKTHHDDVLALLKNL